METEDLIQFSTIANNNNNNNDPKKINDEPQIYLDGDLEDDDQIIEDNRTADEQMDYLESLDFCPHGAKCCIDSVITLFCVTLLG